LQGLTGLLSETNSTLQVQFGYSLDSSNLIILLENGEGVFKSDLISISDLRANPSKNIVINWYNTQPMQVTFESNFTSVIQFCQQPIETAFCMNYQNASDSIIAEYYYYYYYYGFPNMSTSQILSAYSCNQYCFGRGFQVCLDKDHWIRKAHIQMRTC
jgi:hypothetical protein